MKKALSIFLAVSGILSLETFAHAQQLIYQGGYNPNLSFQQYTEMEYPKPQKSIIYVFYSGVPCAGCQKAMDLIWNIFNTTYDNVYDLQVINYEKDREYNYIEAYQLTEDFVVVLVRVDNGATFGYKKLENLQNQVSDTVSFKDNFTYQVDSFLEN